MYKKKKKHEINVCKIHAANLQAEFENNYVKYY